MMASVSMQSLEVVVRQRRLLLFRLRKYVGLSALAYIILMELHQSFPVSSTKV
ncbi:uncharacterized protein M421DRAFT_425755 [Didymella exigua CBS 183.55]|uniref:Uncharacterized protein n=1 Tax=Didymella exigua CBS 183.55 TaxID=1150837 RepID=A0A6A5R5V7_9PLEO|nr:uncharacterized protein M421DRAFT_425755 [Didymella exigua CBS 183.55]KAF1923531.1 hypothetical protein M421DRAFT_425755 [Didymella exigua CBS 183.55]